MAIKVENLCFSYYRQPLCLKDINFSARSGEKILVLGSKEMGKTTFLSTVSGFETSFFGKVEYDGVEVRKLEEDKLKISLLPSEPVFLNGKSIRDNFDFLAQTLKREKFSNEEIKKFLFGPNEEISLDTKVKKLTNAQKKCLALSRAFAKNSDYLFVDDQFDSGNTEHETEINLIYEKLLSCNKTVFITASDETFKKRKSFLKKMKFDEIFYIFDAKLVKFDNLTDFESSLINLNIFNFLDEDYKKVRCEIERQDGFFNLYFESKFISLSEGFNEKLNSKLSLAVGEFEDAVFCAKGDFDTNSFSEQSLNQLLSCGEAFLFSGIDGERLI